MDLLKFAVGNAKLKKDTLIFDLPAGKVCPGAKDCHSWVNVDPYGKRSIQDGHYTQFRCYAASQEVLYTALYKKRLYNLNLLKEALKEDEKQNSFFSDTALLILRSLDRYETKNIKKIRIHSSGDFFSMAYLNAWLEVAKIRPYLKFYCYSKSLNLFLNKNLPNNFFLTASYGGLYDHLISHFKRYAVVVYSKSEAYTLGLMHNGEGYKIDKDDSSCFKNEPFALLLHGSQPKGSTAAAALSQIKKDKVKI